MLPIEFEERMRKMLGEEADAFFAGYDREKFTSLRLNPLKTKTEAFMERGAFSLTPVPWEKNGFYYSGEDTPGKHPYHEAGVYYIQEPSAMAPVPFLEVKPGERVLDLCAAPGGKSTQIAGYLNGEGLLVCNEIHPQRAKILSENVERLGIRNAMVTNETPDRLAEVFVHYFDKILVDAPCSGEGMFRKNEDAKEEWSPANVQICADRQDEILDCAARMLKPGGRIVYSTCTFAPAENEGSISRFLERHNDFVIAAAPMPEGFACGRGDFVENPAKGIERTMRIWPHLVNGEGHYLAILDSTAEPVVGEVECVNGTEKSVAKSAYKDYLTFEKEALKVSFDGTFLLFGDNLYVAPHGMPATKGLRVLRPGLHLGTFKKNRFEPSHALALALTPDEVQNASEISLSDGTAAKYISGQTYSHEGKGWHLVCVDGYSLGWGKAAGGIMKNHYPKGLRKG